VLNAVSNADLGLAPERLTGARMNERRKTVRSNISEAASLFFSPARNFFQCAALDLSGKGAKIALDRLYALPNCFLLSFDHFATARNCRVVWSKGNFVGVQFREAATPGIGQTTQGR